MRGLWAIAATAIVALFVLLRLLDVDVTGAERVPDPSPPAAPTVEAGCGESPDSRECGLMTAFASLDEFWTEQAAELGIDYSAPGMTMFSRSTDQCAAVPDASGPFYCPLDQVVYLDTDVLDHLTASAPAEAHAFIQSYTLAHEWAHHIQSLSGIHDQVARSEREAPAQEELRLELQAECLAGAWAADASSEQVTTAIEATAAAASSEVESWAVGSTEQRERWFTIGMTRGVPGCDTFAPAFDEL